MSCSVSPQVRPQVSTQTAPPTAAACSAAASLNNPGKTLLQPHDSAMQQTVLLPRPFPKIWKMTVITKPNKSGRDDQYLPTTLENLAKLYWAVGKFTVDDDVAVDNYLRITECPIVLQYFHNDFEWQKIREATRQNLLSHMAGFPRHFEIVEEISLGDYDQGESSNLKFPKIRRC